MSTGTMRTRKAATAVMLAAAIWLPAKVFAVSTVSISPAGNGVYLLRGAGIEAASAIEIAVSYDAATLANPRFTEGPLIAGAMTAVNPNVPGIMRMAIIRLAPMSGSGVIATVSFDRAGASESRILSINARFANTRGEPLTGQARIDSANETASTKTEPAHGTAAGPGAAALLQTAPLIVVAGQPEKTGHAAGNPGTQGTHETAGRTGTPEPEREAREEPSTTAEETEGPAGADGEPEAENAPAKEIIAQQSILDRFREYTGKRTPEAFLSLFERDGVYWFRQDPPVALSDGTSAVRVTFVSTPGNKTSSDVAVMGAKLISMRRDPDTTNTWIVDLLPERGGYRAAIAVSQDNVKLVYPLTVAPKVAAGGASRALSRAEFNRAVAARGPASPDGFDANGDGRRDYLDDYIITANYLASGGTGRSRKETRSRAASPRIRSGRALTGTAPSL